MNIELTDLLDKLVSIEKVYPLAASTEITIPKAPDFFIEPSLKKIEGNEKSPFLIITAPGATGKSALSTFWANKQNVYLWNLSGIDIGKNYFSGTLIDSFGESNIPSVITDIQNGKIGFIIDAFDEAEVACGWGRIHNFISEIYKFTKNVKTPTIALIARRETADFIALTLNEVLNAPDYGYYQINFFSKEKSKEFLSRYIENKNPKSLQHHERMLQIFEKIATNVDNILSQKKDTADFPFYGYAPVIQAIAMLFMENENFQKLEADYKNTDFSRKIIIKIINDILIREQKKFLDSFKTNADVKTFSSSSLIIDKFYSVEEQLDYLVYISAGTELDIQSKITSYNLPNTIVSAYITSVKTTIRNHPFLKDGKNFVSAVFQDFCCATLLSTKHTDAVFSFAQTKFFNITPLFWDFYLTKRKANDIEAQHIGIMYESVRSMAKEEIFAVIYNDNERLVLSYEINQATLPQNISINTGTNLAFINHLRNMSIHTDLDIEFYSKGDEFSIYNAEVYTKGKIIIHPKKLEIICHNLEKPIYLSSETTFKFSKDLAITSSGNKNFNMFYPNGRMYPFANYFKEKEESDLKNIDNAMLALRKILRWFRKDKRDSIARFADLINTVVKTSQINQDMLKYLLKTKVIYFDSPFYKMTHREAAKKGINFDALKNAEPNKDLKQFLEDFVK